MGVRERLSDSFSQLKDSIINSDTRNLIWGSTYNRDYSYDDFEFFKSAYLGDDVVNQSINIRSNFATQTGFEVEIDSFDDDVDEEDFEHVKDRANEVIERLRLEHKLGIGQKKRDIYGRAAFEIVEDEDGFPAQLIELKSRHIEPIQDDNFRIIGYEYDPPNTEDSGKDYPIEFEKDEILYFTYNALESDKKGNSSIEPIQDVIKTKQKIRDNLVKASERMWLPVVIHQLDVSEMPEDEGMKQLKEFADSIEPGENMVTNQSIDTETVTMDPNLQDFVQVREMFDQAILGNYGMPKALASRSKTTNRATLETAMKAMTEGQINAVRTYLGKEVEEQIYDKITKQMGVHDQVRLKHNWKPISKLDFMNIAKPVANLVDKNIIGKEKAWELMEWDTSDIDDDEPIEQNPNSTPAEDMDWGPQDEDPEDTSDEEEEDEENVQESGHALNETLKEAIDEGKEVNITINGE